MQGKLAGECASALGSSKQEKQVSTMAQQKPQASSIVCMQVSAIQTALYQVQDKARAIVKAATPVQHLLSQRYTFAQLNSSQPSTVLTATVAAGNIKVLYLPYKAGLSTASV